MEKASDKRWTIAIKCVGFFLILCPLRYLIYTIFAVLLFHWPWTKIPLLILAYYKHMPDLLMLQLLGLALGMGVLNFRRWALWCVLILFWSGLVFGIISLSLPGAQHTTSWIWISLISIFYLWFFTYPKVKEQFK
jgi:hypothetical protein